MQRRHARSHGFVSGRLRQSALQPATDTREHQSAHLVRVPFLLQDVRDKSAFGRVADEAPSPCTLEILLFRRTSAVRPVYAFRVRARMPHRP
jgi:hypothetical protein